MERKVKAGITAAILCVTMVASPTAMASGNQMGIERAGGWAEWTSQLSLAIENLWRYVTDPARKSASVKAEVDPELEIQESDSCSDPTTTGHGCVVDPDG